MTPSQIATYVDAAAAALDLRLRQDYRPGVLRYFTLASEFAAIVDAVPLQPHDEAATTFVPVEPREATE
ncbi:AtzG-like protein [Variovorax humicola]|uniref:AtzG-like protein n=1 Tax=Variovorax humicola TaxID=1769758 RepID=A0ABU8W6C2_9BURK